MRIFPGYQVLLLLSIVVAIVSIVKYTTYEDKYTDDFKETMVRQIIEFANPGTSFNPDLYVPEEEHNNSGLCRYYVNDYDGSN